MSGHSRALWLLLAAALGCRDSGAGSGGAALVSAPEPIGRRPVTGDVAPDFSGLSQTGYRIRLSQFLRKPVAVYFCSAGLDDACEDLLLALRDQWLRYNQKLGMVLAVVPSGEQVNLAFSTQHELPLLVIADTDGDIMKSYGVTAPAPGAPAQHLGWLIGTNRKVLRVFDSPAGAEHVTELIGLVTAP